MTTVSSNAPAAESAAPARTWTLSRQVLTVALLLPPLVAVGLSGPGILMFPPVGIFLAIFTILALVTIWRSNRWVQLVGGVLLLLFALMNLAFLGPSLLRPDRYPNYVIAWTVVMAGLTGAVAGIAAFREGRQGTATPPRWGSAWAVATVLVAGFVIGTGAAGIEMQIAPSAAVGTVVLTPQATVDVAIAHFQFSPATIDIPAGQIVKLTITNQDRELHTFTIDALGVDAEIGPGKSVDVWLQAQAGTYQVYCTPHTEANGEMREGMVGTLVVA